MTSKDDRLGEHLAAIGAATIVLSFAEVEAVVGPLPNEARHHAAWWGVTRGAPYTSVHALHWRRRGYVADRPDFAAGTVIFRRVALVRERQVDRSRAGRVCCGENDGLTKYIALLTIDLRGILNFFTPPAHL